LFQGKETAATYFFVSVCHELSLSKAKNCSGAGVCWVRKHGDSTIYTALGRYNHRAMTYYKDEGMLILKYCSDECSSKFFISPFNLPSGALFS